ncbi:MAG: polymer-forming cytoskeletal protein [Methanocorpusculum sp.]|uniref:polymer-forming cytoskeletal protein n=1 Tax=Methanocorpusculum sp. TaxID=2058474 RepID=UPI002720292E|nr:polymer-forming cytoskeletal protein [Methanocorpusculum sp.]MDO9523686.1 polymer-forming cytoskeletal protein [Methanocorpusculum sp.]
MVEDKKRIIIAESLPEEEEKFLTLPELTPEEEKELEEQASEDIGDNPEPLFSEVTPEQKKLLDLNISEVDEDTASMVLSSSELFKTCYLPDKTELQERNLKTKHDILIGDHCDIGYGLYGDDIVISELSTMHGDIVAEGDLRIDNFCEVHGTVLCNGDAYLGEGVKIHGKLNVGGNLDIGDNVVIDKEFKAYGDIAIRNPMPVVLYLLLYVITMLHLEGEEAARKRVENLISEVNASPLVLPPKTTMDLRYFSVPTPMEIGANCRLHGNIRAQSVKVRKDTTLFGSIQATQRIKLGPRTAIHGDVVGQNIRVERGADVLGDVAGRTVWLHEDARVSGVIKATDGLTIGHTDGK